MLPVNDRYPNSRSLRLAEMVLGALHQIVVITGGCGCVRGSETGGRRPGRQGVAEGVDDVSKSGGYAIGWGPAVELHAHLDDRDVRLGIDGDESTCVLAEVCLRGVDLVRKKVLYGGDSSSLSLP